MVVTEELLNSVRQAVAELGTENKELESTISALQNKKLEVDEDLFALEHFLHRHEKKVENNALAIDNETKW